MLHVLHLIFVHIKEQNCDSLTDDHNNMAKTIDDYRSVLVVWEITARSIMKGIIGVTSFLNYVSYLQLVLDNEE